MNELVDKMQIVDIFFFGSNEVRALRARTKGEGEL